MRVLSDCNIEGDAFLLWGTLAAEGWLELLPLRLVTFKDLAIPWDIDDRSLWRLCQHERIILLTGNRNMTGLNSLEQTLREENTPNSLPVLTIGRARRLTALEELPESPILAKRANSRGVPQRRKGSEDAVTGILAAKIFCSNRCLYFPACLLEYREQCAWRLIEIVADIDQYLGTGRLFLP